MVLGIFEDPKTTIERTAKEQHERKMKEESQKVLEKEEQEKVAFKEAEDVKHEEELKAKEVEIGEEARRALEETEAAVRKCRETREAKEKELAELEEKLMRRNEKFTEHMKQKGSEEVKEAKKQLKEECEQFVAQKELLSHELRQLANVELDESKKVGERIRKMKEEETERSRTHLEVMADLKRKEQEEEVKTRRRLVEIGKEQKRFAIQMNAQQSHLQAVQMTNTFALMDVHTKDQLFEDFRKDAKGIISQCSRFKRVLVGEESDLLTTRDRIAYGEPVTCPPEIRLITRALQKLSELLQTFTVDGSNAPEKFKTLRNNVSEIVDSITTVFNDMQSAIDRYREQKEPWNLIEGGESVDTSRFDISEMYKTAKKLIGELSERILEFNIPASTAFDDTLTRQFEQLSICQEKVINQPIMGSTETVRVAAVEDVEETEEIREIEDKEPEDPEEHETREEKREIREPTNEDIAKNE